MGWQVNLGRTYLFHEVRIWKDSRDLLSLSEFNLSVLNDEGKIVFHNRYQSSFQTDVVEIKIPFVYGAALKIQLIGKTKFFPSQMSKFMTDEQNTFHNGKSTYRP